MRQAGFTLMETLVAVIITSLTVTVFFQLLSGSMNLERRGRDVVLEAMVAEQTFTALQRKDIREADFPWTGQAERLSWRLHVFPEEVRDAFRQDDEADLRLPTELYRYTFHYSWRDGPDRTLVAFMTHPPDFFDDQFRATHLDPSP